MNVGKIQRLSETHENLDVFLKMCLISGVKLEIHGQGHDKVLDSRTTELLLPCLRKGIRMELEGFEAQIIKEVTHGN